MYRRKTESVSSLFEQALSREDWGDLHCSTLYFPEYNWEKRHKIWKSPTFYVAKISAK